MPERHQLLPGSFCWPELATPDSARAKEFYSGLFGWNPVDVPSSGGTYTILQLEDKDVAALRSCSEKELTERIPSHWLSYISVASTDDSAGKVRELGGQVLHGPFDVETIGRMAVVADPEGTPFALWEERGHIGARVVGEPGALCWTELATRDPDRARSFYSGLFGWELKSSASAAADYLEIYRDGQPIGGILPMTKEWGEIPSHWMPYFQVPDCDAAVSKSKELGGESKVPPMNIPNVGRFSVLCDPMGAHFSVIALAAM